MGYLSRINNGYRTSMTRICLDSTVRSELMKIKNIRLPYNNHLIGDVPLNMKTVIPTYLIFHDHTLTEKQAVFAKLDTIGINDDDGMDLLEKRLDLLRSQAQLIAAEIGGRVVEDSNKAFCGYPNDTEFTVNIVAPKNAPDIVRVYSPAVFREHTDDHRRPAILFAIVNTGTICNALADEFFDERLEFLFAQAEKTAKLIGGYVDIEKERTGYCDAIEYTVNIILPQKPQP